MTNTVPLRVFGARAIIKMEEATNQTMGGIIIPGAENEQVTKGVVVAVGQGMRLDNGTLFPMEVGIGDKVIISPNAGSPVAVEGDSADYLVVNEAHIMAVMEG